MSKRSIILLSLFMVINAISCGKEDKEKKDTPPDLTFTMEVTLEPGAENEQCKFFQIDNDINVVKSKTTYSEGSHHVLFLTTSFTELPTKNLKGETIDPSKIFDCSDGAAFGMFGANGVAGGSQSPDAEAILDLPEGIAMTYKKGSVFILNAHYLNASEKSVTANVSVDMWTTDSSKVQTQAGVIFWYNPFISVPPKETATARMVCPITKDITLLNAQSHMHARGIGYSAHLLSDKREFVETLYQGTKWEDPDVTVYDNGGKKLTAGTFIDYKCNYKNDSDRHILQGLTTKDEMCMFVGVYYPKDNQLGWCGTSDKEEDRYMAGFHIGDGDNTCGESYKAFTNAKDIQEDGGMSLFPAFTDICESNSAPLALAAACTMQAQALSCAEQCGQQTQAITTTTATLATTATTTDDVDTSGNPCSDCIQKTCAEQLQVCFSAVCSG